jgi:hypothetical protein
VTHPVEYILEAVAAAVANATPSSVSVFTHRRNSLSADAGELPAISVDYAEDEAAESGVDLSGIIQSVLTVNVTALVTDADEAPVRTGLLDIRALVHAAIAGGLGLDFVLGVEYAGAAPPDVYVEGEAVVGELTSAWRILYEILITAE